MDIEKALPLLQKAGAISSAYLPGMRFTHPASRGGATASRVLDVERLLGGSVRLTVHDGVVLLRYTLRDDGWIVEDQDDEDRWSAAPIHWHSNPRVWKLDLRDPATTGCLWQLYISTEPGETFEEVEWAASMVSDGAYPAERLVWLAEAL